MGAVFLVGDADPAGGGRLPARREAAALGAGDAARLRQSDRPRRLAAVLQGGIRGPHRGHPRTGDRGRQPPFGDRRVSGIPAEPEHGADGQRLAAPDAGARLGRQDGGISEYHRVGVRDSEVPLGGGAEHGGHDRILPGGDALREPDDEPVPQRDLPGGDGYERAAVHLLHRRQRTHARPEIQIPRVPGSQGAVPGTDPGGGSAAEHHGLCVEDEGL